MYYKCDVSKWEEVEAISKKVIEEVNPFFINLRFQIHKYALGWPSDYDCQQRRRGSRQTDPRP